VRSGGIQLDYIEKAFGRADLLFVAVRAAWSNAREFKYMLIGRFVDVQLLVYYFVCFPLFIF
jgi:hypothetical protein